MVAFLTGLEVAISIALVVLILLQNRGSSLGSLGGGGTGVSFSAERRGAERTIFIATAVLAVAFVAVAFALSAVL